MQHSNWRRGRDFWFEYVFFLRHVGSEGSASPVFGRCFFLRELQLPQSKHQDMGFSLFATKSTHDALSKAGLACSFIYKPLIKKAANSWPSSFLVLKCCKCYKILGQTVHFSRCWIKKLQEKYLPGAQCLDFAPSWQDGPGHQRSWLHGFERYDRWLQDASGCHWGSCPLDHRHQDGHLRMCGDAQEVAPGEQREAVLGRVLLARTCRNSRKAQVSEVI